MSEEGELRRLQRSGRSSYIVVLPKRWVEEARLREGKSVYVAKQADGSLLISPYGPLSKPSMGEAQIELRQDDDANAITRKIISAYLHGYSAFYVRAKGARLGLAQRMTVKEAIRRYLIGTEVVSESAEGVVAQVLVSYPELDVEGALRRMALIAQNMHRNALDALRRLDRELAEAVIRADDEVDRFAHYVDRQLNLAVQLHGLLRELGLRSPKDCLSYKLIAKSVERVADHASQLASIGLSLREGLSPKLLEALGQLSEDALEVFRGAMEALYKRSYEVAESIVGAAKSVARQGEQAIAELSLGETDLRWARVILEHIRRTAEYASDIAEAVLNVTAEGIVVKALGLREQALTRGP